MCMFMFGYEYCVAVPSGLAVYDHTPAGFAGTNPAGNVGVCLL